MAVIVIGQSHCSMNFPFSQSLKGLALLIVFTLLSAFGRAQAANINAGSCSRADVGTAVQNAADGDTVLVPAGTCTWTSTLRIEKGITLRGAGIDNTIIIDEIPRSNATQSLFIVITAEGKSYRLSGFTLQRGTTNIQMNWNSAVIVGGTSKSWRIDHVKFSRLAASAIRIYDYTYGVIDHCVFDMKDTQSIIVGHQGWGGGSYGDGSWAAPLALGTEKAIYIEDNTFASTGTKQTVDSMDGGRFVFRYNTVNNMYAGNHGTDSSQRRRSSFSYEFYNNTFTHPSNWFTAIYLRGGTGVIFNNTFNGYSSGITVRNFRSDQAYTPWGKCDGSSSYDGKQISNGYPCIDQVGRSTGTLLSGSTPQPVAWPKQISEPLYEWNNTLNGSDADIGSNHPSYIQEGRDFFNDTQKPGYTPYVYPHPLATTGSQPSASTPSTPKNFRQTHVSGQ